MKTGYHDAQDVREKLLREEIVAFFYLSFLLFTKSFYL